MTTTKTRINLTLPPVLEDLLQHVARRDNVPTATKAVALLALALEIEEDTLWDRLARVRDTNQIKYIPHAQAWL